MDEWTDVEMVPKGAQKRKDEDDKKVVNVKDLNINQLKQIGGNKIYKMKLSSLLRMNKINLVSSTFSHVPSHLKVMNFFFDT